MDLAARTVELMDPRGNPHVGQTMRAPRLDRLDGKTLGLLDNGKPHFDLFLSDLEHLLRARYPSIKIVQRTKPVVPRPVPEDMLAELAETCDAVITGIGD